MSLSILREEIDSLNEEMIQLVGKRIAVARKIAQIKKEKQLPILDANREEQVRETVKKLAKELGLSAAIMVEVIQLIMDYSRIEMGIV